MALVPALQGTHRTSPAPSEATAPGAVSPVSSGCATRGSLRRLTISLLLLVGVGFVLRSFQQVQSVDPGFGREPSAIETFLTPVARFKPAVPLRVKSASSLRRSATA